MSHSEKASQQTKNRVYRINTGNSFLIEDIGQATFYQSYGSTLKNEPSLSFMRLLRDSSSDSLDDKNTEEASNQTMSQVIQNKVILEGYFNDLYKLFLRKLSAFDCQLGVAEDDKRRLRLLLDEIIKVKGILDEESV